eukprot:g768.t1
MYIGVDSTQQQPPPPLQQHSSGSENEVKKEKLTITKEALEEFYADNSPNNEAYDKNVAGIDKLLQMKATDEILQECQKLYNRTPATTIAKAYTTASKPVPTDISVHGTLATHTLDKARAANKKLRIMLEAQHQEHSKALQALRQQLSQAQAHAATVATPAIQKRTRENNEDTDTEKAARSGNTPLAQLRVDREVQARSLRVLLAGHHQMWLQVSGANLWRPQAIIGALAKQHPELGLPTKVREYGRDYEVQYHETAGELDKPAYRLFREGELYREADQNRLLCGAKVRIIPKHSEAGGNRNTRLPLVGRAVPVSVVKSFHAAYPGDNSRAKQHQMLADVQISPAGGVTDSEVYEDERAYGRMKPGELPVEFRAGREYALWLYPGFEHDKTFPEKDKRLIDGKHLQLNPKRSSDEGLSWVEWAAADAAGPADLMISYSWSLNWAYLVAFVEEVFGPEIRVWIDILACGQHKIERGAMDEISLLPEVLDFAGKTLVMPGTVSRMWCNYEFGWSVELNSKQLFYANFRDLDYELRVPVEAKLSRELQQDVDALVSCDKQLLALPGALLLEYPNVQVATDTLGGVDAALDGTEGAYLAKRPAGVLATRSHRVMMYKSAKVLEVASTALTLCGRCWKQSDEEYIRETIQNRLGGRMQVCLTIKEAFGVKNDGSEDAASELAADTSEEEVMISFFMGSLGPQWKNKENWCNDEVPLEDWFGVGVNHDGKVTSLDLSRNGVLDISPLILRLSLLSVVNLQENPQLDSAQIATIISLGGTMTSLNISDNRLESEGAERIAEALKQNKTLRFLNIKNNDIGEEGKVFIGNALPCSHVQFVVCDEWAITEDTTELNCSSINLCAADAILLAGVIANNRRLNLLNIHGNDIGDEGRSSLGQALPGSNIQYMICDDWAITEETTELSVHGKRVSVVDALLLAGIIRNNESLEAITFGAEKTITITTEMNERDCDGKDLGPGGAIIVAAFVPKCKQKLWCDAFTKLTELNEATDFVREIKNSSLSPRRAPPAKDKTTVRGCGCGDNDPSSNVMNDADNNDAGDAAFHELHAELMQITSKLSMQARQGQSTEALLELDKALSIASFEGNASKAIVLLGAGADPNWNDPDYKFG